MSDRGAVVLAVGTVAGAQVAWGASPVLGALVVLAALLARRPALLCLGAALLASGLSASAQRDAEAAAPTTGPYRGTITLASDPITVPGGVAFDARASGRKLSATVRGDQAARVGDRLAGERLVVRGSTRPLVAPTPSQRVRHVVGRLDIHTVIAVRSARRLDGAANALRRLLERGAGSLSRDQQALFSGMVLGDDRDQHPTQVDDFRAAGLSHLLAVSGQNVAFVLVIAAPLLSRLSLWVRLPGTVAVLGAFALLTRFEPSVLRAVTMAGIGALATTLGRPASSLRVLALAVTGLVLVDPFLVDSVGFQLSVMASFGLVVAAPAVARRLPGPRWLANAAAVCFAAQLGVAPLLIGYFGGIPVAALPANLLAVPASGPVMVWGLTAGPIAGVLGDNAATLIHLPTRLLVSWVDGVARAGAALPLGELRALHLAGVVLGGLIVVGPARRRARAVVGGVAITAASVAPALQLAAPDPLQVTAGTAVELWRVSDSTVVVLGARARAADALEGLRRRGVRRIDILVVEARSAASDLTVVSLVRRYRPAMVLGKGLAGGPRLVPGTVIDAGGLRVQVASRDPLLVDVTRRHPE